MTIGTRVTVHGRSGVVVTIKGITPVDGYIVVKFDDKTGTYLGEMVKKMNAQQNKQPNLLPAEQRKLRTFYQMHRRNQATKIRVQRNDLELIGFQHLMDLGYACVVEENEWAVVFDATEIGLALGRALDYRETISNA